MYSTLLAPAGAGLSPFLNEQAVLEKVGPLGFKNLESLMKFVDKSHLIKHFSHNSRALLSSESTEEIHRLIPDEKCQEVANFNKAKKKYNSFLNRARSSIARNDPVIRLLRPSISYSGSFATGNLLSEDTKNFVAPDSIQSELSPAGYLFQIYAFSKNITHDDDCLNLSARRPDLANLELSKKNLEEEISTLELVNELLIDQLLSGEGKNAKKRNDPAPKGNTGNQSSEEELFKSFESKVYPLSLPFHRENCIVRESLSSMSGLSLSIMANRSRLDDYALDDTNFSLVPNHVDTLRLYKGHVALFNLVPGSDAEFYEKWFGLSDGTNGNSEMQFTDKYCSSVEISFDQFLTLCSDTSVRDEDNEPFPNLPIRFCSVNSNVYLNEYTEGSRKTYKTSSIKEEGKDEPVTSKVHEFQNNCIRLSLCTGLPIRDLDCLLLAAAHSHPDFSGTEDEAVFRKVLSDGSGLRVIAHFMFYQEKFGMGVAEFAAMVGDVNSTHAVGNNSTSLMRKLFGNNAQEITRRTRRYMPKDQKTGTDLDAEGWTSAFREGLKVTEAEWKVISALASYPSKIVDSVLLGQLYRLATMFRILNWDVLKGCQLVERLDLHTILATSSDNTKILPAMDKLVWLNDWMTEIEISVDEMLQLLTNADQSNLIATQDTWDIAESIQQGIQSYIVVESDFTKYKEWPRKLEEGNNSDNDETSVTITESEWIEGLKGTVIDDSYLVITDYSHTLESIATFLISKNVDMDADESKELQMELAGRIDGKNKLQDGVISSQIAKSVESLTEKGVPSLLKWASLSPYQVKDTLFNWKTESNPQDQTALQLIYVIQTHINVSNRLKLQDAELNVIVESPEIIAPNLPLPLSLKQVYLLSRFKLLLTPMASSNDWISCLIEAGKGNDQDNHFLSRLLEYPREEVIQLVSSDFNAPPGKKVQTMQDADFIARQISICQDTAMGASELLAVEKLNEVSADGKEWNQASQAIKVTLNRFESGNFFTVTMNHVNEQIRDAVVGEYMVTKIGAGDNEKLKSIVTDDESLYQYLLIDVKVSGAVPTTRLLQATYSIQLYINLALENVEKVDLEDRDTLLKEWEVMGQYRVWEANEKLSLNPANYIEPELRRGKSDTFRDFENQLTQGSIDEDSAQNAIHAYIGSLQRLSELEVHGFCIEREMDKKTFHLTAKANWEKNSYYYRTLQVDTEELNDGSRSALNYSDWKKVSIAISAESSHGVVPCIAWGRLFLFWLEVHRISDGEQEQGKERYKLEPRYSRQNLDGTFTDPYTPETGNLSLEITDALSEYEDYEPLFYQPYFNEETDEVKLYFNIDPRNTGALRENQYLWTLSTTSGAVISKFDDKVLRSPTTISGYRTIPQTAKEDALTASKDREYSKIGSLECIHKGARFSGSKCKFSIIFEEGNQIRIKSSIGKMDVIHSHHNNIAASDIHVMVVLPSQCYTMELFRPAGKSGMQTTSNINVERVVKEDVKEFNYEVWIIAQFRDLSTKQVLQYREKFTSGFVSDSNVLAGKNCELFEGLKTIGISSQRFILDQDEEASPFVYSLYSNGTRNFTSSVHDGTDVRFIYNTDMQRPLEFGISEFIETVEEEFNITIKDPKPDLFLDYYGPYGLYAWELFFHIPMLVASRCVQNSNHDYALSWLAMVFNPRYEPEKQWIAYPLRDGTEYTSSSSITDPDELAKEDPEHYRISVIKQYLQTVIGKGDILYRTETPESLRLAKMNYVSANNFFLDASNNTLNTLTMTTWTSPPKLGTVESSDFRVPINYAIFDFRDTLQQRITYLREWKSIDGEPLTIPLIAPEIDPRALQLAALSGTGISDINSSSSSFSNQTKGFNEVLGRVENVVKQFIALGDLLRDALQDKDDQQVTDLETQLLHFIASGEKGSSEDTIGQLNRDMNILIHDENEIIEYMNAYKKFSNERFNDYEITGMTFLAFQNAQKLIASASAVVAGGLKSFPNIVGAMFGNQDISAGVEAVSIVTNNTADVNGILADQVMFVGDCIRRQEENRMEFNATSHAFLSLQKAKKNLESEIAQEKATIENLDLKVAKTLELVEVQSQRSTNADFHKWYVSQITSLYNSSYDIAVRFCRMVERIYQNERNDYTRFINPVWNAEYAGLLSGQSLLLDLQRMELAYIEGNEVQRSSGRIELSLKELNPAALRTLQNTGRAVFSISRDSMDRLCPNEEDRRIKTIRVEIQSTRQRKDRLCGRLSIVSHSTMTHRNPGNQAVSKVNVSRRHRISLMKNVTDTNDLKKWTVARKDRPFEDCGVESTWMLSFPAAMKQSKKKDFSLKPVLSSITDVAITIRYTSHLE